MRTVPERVGLRSRIRTRFTLLYAATVLLLLLVAATVTRQALRATLQQEFDESVRASAALVSQFFRTEIAEYRSIEATLTHISGELVFEDRAMHIRRPDDSHFGDSVSMPRGTVSRMARGQLSAPVRAVRFPLDKDLAPGWDVEVHASLANLHALLRRIDRWFGFGIPALVGVAAMVGWWLTGRTLRPVGQMADAAARIAPVSGERLPLANPGDELGRLGERFNALLDQLDGALVQQRAFLADAAHELRTPIARMRARVEVAQLAAAGGLTTASPASHEDTLRALEAELRVVSQHLDELMQLAQADAAGDDAPLRREHLFLDDLVSDEVPRWRPQAEQAGLRLDMETPEEAPVQGDAVLLRRLLGVLLDNALRYAAPQDAQAEEATGRVRVKVAAHDTQVELLVEDSGPGIAPAERERVFDRFFRGEDARRRRADGSGLGLAIAAWVVQRHRGSIRIEDSPLGGAAFRVTLPRA
ncbi:sensor histidine kinase [Gemmatimonas sp. UBA7669]|uniref:sensor histidine kinase n=1 Tax=Gemmatimonas sp. UBA7669 TaxID=1946568 RepID=UPI0025B8E5D0|nr:HAMP domain-containing sensor histidine kinase [Gemmatimonas sp. UBA7669]